MTALLWIAFGVTLGACLLHAALGLIRPINRKYVAFSAMMGLLGPFVLMERNFYRAESSEVAVFWIRAQAFIGLLFLLFFVGFVRAYTNLRIPRIAMGVFGVGIIGAAIGNVLLPSGIMYGFSKPELVTERSFGQETIHTLQAPTTAIPSTYMAFYTSVFVFAIACGVKMFRRGQRRQGAVLTFAVSVVVLASTTDIIHDAIRGNWPYVLEFSGVAMGLIMSAQLAIDFQLQDQELATALAHVQQQAAGLTRMLEASLALQKNMAAPLMTLDVGLRRLSVASPGQEEQLARARRAIARLAALERSMTASRQPGDGS